MLRARPIHYTSHFEQWATLLQALGLAKTVDDGDWQEFDAGSGRVALGRLEHGHPPLDGYTIFSVEVGNLEEFARRTEEDGTQAELHEASYGPRCVSRPTTVSSFSLSPPRDGQRMAAGPRQTMQTQHSRW